MVNSEATLPGWVPILIRLQSILDFHSMDSAMQMVRTVPTSTFNTKSIIQENLQPSRKYSREVGFEMRFLKSRVGFDVTVYQDNTKNQILEIPAPMESGASSILINAGNIQNKGMEISIDATPVTTTNFRWNTALNYSRNRNMIVELLSRKNRI